MELNKLFQEYGLIDVCSLDPTIKVDLRYATCSNFTHKQLYPKNISAYCEPSLAKAIAATSQCLHQLYPNLYIVIYDAARPLSVQRHMFDLVKGTESQRYIADPYGPFSGGFHNYGMAVDMALCNADGEMLDFGTGFDSFSTIAHVGNEQQMVRDGIITPQAYANRMLLYHITALQGMLPYAYEWWHYQIHQNEEDKQRFLLLDF